MPTIVMSVPCSVVTIRGRELERYLADWEEHPAVGAHASE